MNIDKEIKKLEARILKLKDKQELERRKLKFKCGCGRNHSIKECKVIRTHWYVPPSGCTAGGYWNEGEFQIICPDTKVRNRVLFDSIYDIPWDKRNMYENNLEQQFKKIYLTLFSEIIDSYDSSLGGNWCNNYDFDRYREKFGLSIKYVS